MERGRDKSAISITLNGLQPGSVFLAHEHAAQAREGRAFDGAGQGMGGREIRHKPGAKRHDGPVMRPGQKDPRQSGAGMMQGNFAAGGFHGVAGKTEVQQRFFIRGGKGQMIDPFKEVGASLSAHPLRQLLREGIVGQEAIDGPAQESFGGKDQRPVELLCRAGGVLFEKVFLAGTAHISFRSNSRKPLPAQISARYYHGDKSIS